VKGTRTHNRQEKTKNKKQKQTKKETYKSTLEVILAGGVANGLLDGEEAYNFPEIGLKGEDVLVCGEGERGRKDQVGLQLPVFRVIGLKVFLQPKHLIDVEALINRSKVNLDVIVVEDINCLRMKESKKALRRERERGKKGWVTVKVITKGEGATSCALGARGSGWICHPVCPAHGNLADNLGDVPDPDKPLLEALQYRLTNLILQGGKAGFCIEREREKRT